MLNIGLVGANGRMGKSIVRRIKHNPDKYNLKCAIVSDMHTIDNEVKDVAQVCSEDLDMLNGVDVVIDFSSPKSSLVLLPVCIENKLPVVIGTTGFNEFEREFMQTCSSDTPILYAPNTSLSVNVLYKVIEIVAKRLRGFDVEITEAHHRYKKDAPSGTALKLGEIIAKERDIAFEDFAKFDRHGLNEVRREDEIGYSVIRGGDIVGMHDVQFINDGEALSVKSQITNRECFANGALLAAEFLHGKSVGLYNMWDVLGL